MPEVLVISDNRAADGPYGIDRLQDLGYLLFQAEALRSRRAKKLRDVVEHRWGRPVDMAVRSARPARRVDVILCFLEQYAMVPSALKARGIAPYAGRPLAMIACWLADDLRRLEAAERRALARRYRGVDLAMVFSANQKDVLCDAGLREEAVEPISFGLAPEQHEPTDFAVRSDRIAAVGFDRGRDYRTLMDAVRGTELQVDLYCGEGNLRGIGVPRNVTFHGVVPYDEYRKVISTAGLVAVTTHSMEYPSGQTVALESAATGACVALSDTRALGEYFSASTALMLPVGDVDAWRRGLSSAMVQPELRRTIGAAAQADVRERFTYRNMWERVDALFRARGWVH